MYKYRDWLIVGVQSALYSSDEWKLSGVDNKRKTVPLCWKEIHSAVCLREFICCCVWSSTINRVLVYQLVFWCFILHTCNIERIYRHWPVRYSVTNEIMIPLFKRLVRPILEYGNVVWCPRLKRQVQLIENVQRKFTINNKRVLWFGLRRKITETNFPSLVYRRLRGDLIEACKILHGFYDQIMNAKVTNAN